MSANVHPGPLHNPREIITDVACYECGGDAYHELMLGPQFIKFCRTCGTRHKPLDGSDSSEHAIDRIMRLAEEAEAEASGDYEEPTPEEREELDGLGSSNA